MKKPVRILALHRETIRALKALDERSLYYVAGGSVASLPALRAESGNVNCPAQAVPAASA